MAVLYISEYALPSMGNLPLGQEPVNTDQTVAIGAGSVQSAAFAKNTSIVRLEADSVCSVSFGTNPIATATNKRLAAGVPEYFYVPQGLKLAVIQNT